MDATTIFYHFLQQRCVKTSRVGISRQINIARIGKNEAAHSLNIGDWALFDSDDEYEQLGSAA